MKQNETKKVPKSSEDLGDFSDDELLLKNDSDSSFIEHDGTKMKQTFHQKVPKYSCEYCQYDTTRESQWKRHLETKKHSDIVSSIALVETDSKLRCDNCGLKCNSRTTLWRHRKNCNVQPPSAITSDLIIALINDNKDTKQLMIQILQNIVPISQTQQLTTVPMTPIQPSIVSGNIYKNSNNKITNNSFNLNFFLNETCKDAMDIMEFVDSINLTVEDLERVGELGYADGISHIFVKHLKELVKEMRPLHCCDLKREVIYVRNNNQWLKHIIDKQILIKAIKKLANENIKMIMVWKKMYPDCTEATSRKNDTYLKIVSNSMCGIDKAETEKNMEKIVRNIARCVVIDKHGGL